MSRDVRKLRNHVIVCGYGRVGRILAARLADARRDVVVVEMDPSRIIEAESEGHLVVGGDGADETVLRAAGIEQAAELAAVLSSDSSNVFVTLTATGINRSIRVIARAEDPSGHTKLKRSGADDVILPAAIGADRIANLITRPSAQELLRSG